MFKGITIDGPTTRDRDDAIWVERDGDGLTVTVCISDVASAVPLGHKHDVSTEEHRGAYERIETKYHANGNNPMLPRFLSEDKLSLTPHRKRKVMAITIPLGRDGGFAGEPTIAFGPFQSLGALAYPEIPDILNDAEHEWHEQITLARMLADVLLDRRRDAGAMVIYDLNKGWATNEDGMLAKLDRDDSTIGYVIVQELMILANQSVARFCALNDIPVLYRNHTAKSNAPDRDEILTQLNDAMGQGIGVIHSLCQRMNLVFNRAEYGPVLKGHYGLNLPAYVHSTSPIRRYADLVNQRQLLKYCTRALAAESLPYTHDDLVAVAEHINTTLRERREATSEFLRQRDHNKMEHHLSAIGQLYQLTTKEFDRAVKVAVKSGRPMPDGFAIVFGTRMERGEASLLAKATVLAEAPDSWAELKRDIITWLGEHPHDATSLVNVAAQTSNWPLPKVRVQNTGDTHQPMFTARASAKRDDQTIMGPMVVDRAKKHAKQRATVGLLAILAGVELGETAGLSEPVPPPEPESVPLPMLLSPNPIGALQNYCVAKGVGMPAYEGGSDGGTAHAPVFKITCSVDGLHVSATERGPTKKEARRNAAELVIRTLHTAADLVEGVKQLQADRADRADRVL